MKIDDVLNWLFEELEHDALDAKAKAFVDRLLLRIMTSPALLSFLEGTQIKKEGSDFVIELLFRKVPPEQINVIRQLIAEENKAYTFETKGQTHYAFRIRLTPEDLTGDPDSQNGPVG